MVFDLKDPKFWDEGALLKEMYRIFDICNGCRLCYNLCPSFEFLFKKIDETDNLDDLTKEDYFKVVELCYDCKLCFPKCPYTPPHHYELDFPRLMLRAKAVKAEKEGIPLRDKILGQADLIGKLGSKFAGLINLANRLKVSRVLMEKILGIHRERNLPEYHSETFEKWFKGYSRQNEKKEKGTKKVVLFYTCTVNYNEPELGKAIVKVLEHNDIDVVVPEQKCCGMPFLDGGDINSAIKSATFNVKSLVNFVKQGFDVVVPAPTCSYMLKQEYPVLLPDDEDAKLVSQHTYDISEYLMKIHREGKLKTDFKNPQGKIIYHLPCHLKAQNIGYKSRDLLELIPGTEVEMIQRCSGHDGTWSMKKEFFEMSMRVGKPIFDKINQSDSNSSICSDCLLAQLQIEKGTGKKGLHPIQILYNAYGLNEEK
jgi:glycerol-3-phosphate dehydrogenase subunit C